MYKPTILKENKKYNALELLLKFNLKNKDELTQLLITLREYGYLNMYVKNENSIVKRTSIEKVFMLSAWDDINQRVRFDFNLVGLLILPNNTCIISYPKYISDFNIELDIKNNYKKFKQIMKVIEKYKHKNAQDVFGIDTINNIQNDNIGVQLSILKRFYEMGLFHKEVDIISSGEEGQILWNNTISNITPFIVGQTPVYLDFYTQKIQEDSLNIIRLIHSIIITEISSEFKNILEVIGYYPVIMTEKSFDDIGGKDYAYNLVEKELRSQYVTKNKELLKELLCYIKQVKYHTHNEVKFYGTSSFNLVWEDVCRAVYHNHLEYTFEKLGILNPGKNSSNQITMKEYIEKPQWLMPDDTFINANSTLELDVLNIQNGEFNIYDAKYYNVYFENGRIQGQPGVSDITKQYLYQLLFKDVIKHNELVPSNNFIIPKDELENDNELYTVSKMNMFHDLEENLREINVIARDCQNIYKEYLDM
ncbi:LlaJI family restriction endonuclease [Staphylococcus simulans]|uniref:LlaJI family restriction endonuclease n=1 Tax=Staphylococcus simulans TaxID=1286 RepID=UPI0021D27525|nr:LlaJI family restriction endonuclease [Staphylococcus simulans]UXV37761.1 LlaJI family restriction endonuclease [Staphylococcus simulans]UXV40209.1 LlaJI family restriction endonuclease [Staphylococcus simulans]